MATSLFDEMDQIADELREACRRRSPETPRA